MPYNKSLKPRDKSQKPRDDLTKRAAKARKDIDDDEQHSEPGYWEANIAFFLLLVLTAGMPMLSVMLIGYFHPGWFIAFASIAFVLTIVAFVVGYMAVSGSNLDRILFYTGFMLSALSISFSVAAVIAYSEVELTSLGIFDAFLVGLGVAVLDFIILCVPKLWVQGTGLIIMTVASIAAIFVGFSYIESYPDFGIMLAIIGGAFTLLHLAMIYYVYAGKAFFAVLPLAYIAVTLIALVIAILVALQCDSCDCDGGCFDCAPDASGGRGRFKGRDMYWDP